MQAKNLGLLSAIVGSACCVGPAFLVILGVFGFAGGFFTRYHWFFIAAGAVGVAVAWWQYGRERRKLRAMAARMRNEEVTRLILAFATALIVIVTGLDAYPLLVRRSAPAAVEARSLTAESSIVIPTAGMDCPICAVPIKARLKQLPGVSVVDVSTEKGTVSVKYDPAKVRPGQLVATINSTGYKATLPEQ